MNKIKTIFFGTPGFACASLQKLIDDERFDVLAVVTQPDKPVGRKKELTAPAVKELAMKNNINIRQPVKLDDNFVRILKNVTLEEVGRSRSGVGRSRSGQRDDRVSGDSIAQPSASLQNDIDLFVVVAYGKILPKELLDIPRHGTVNIHPSLLPKYRGPSPLQATILNGDIETGVTIMIIDEKMDHGPLLGKFEYRISKSETYESLGNKLFKLGTEKLPDIIINYINGKITPQDQDHSAATYTKLIKKEDGLIDWTKTASEIERMVRAYYPWPNAYGQVTVHKKQLTIKIFKAKVGDEKTDIKPGIMFKTDNNTLTISCGEGSVLIIEELQVSGKNKMTAQDFLKGHQI